MNTPNNDQESHNDEGQNVGDSQRKIAKGPAWTDQNDTHDVVLTGEYLASLPIGSVISVLMTASSGTGHRIPIAFAKRGDDMWDVHARSWVNSKRLIGGRATPRKRRSPRESAPIPDTVPQTTARERVSFAEAAARMRLCAEA